MTSWETLPPLQPSQPQGLGGKGRSLATSPPGEVSPIAYSSPPCDWKTELALSLRSPAAVANYLGLSLDRLPPVAAAERSFPTFAPRPYLNRVKPENLADPLLRQVWPAAQEDDSPPGFVLDPLQEAAAQPTPGLLQKYAGRALMVLTQACAIHCRYCFRRHFDYSVVPHGLAAWQPSLNELTRSPDIHEVLWSGGDPLMLVDSALSALAAELAKITHVRRLRIHTRLPVMIPSRINEELLAWLTGTRLIPYVVVHINHAQEIDEEVAAALDRLTGAGIPLLNQTVLLAGVNDSLPALFELSEALVDHRVIPYYLHQLDPVQGVAHFEVPVSRGLELVSQLMARLPGYAVPRYVQELPGESSKVPVLFSRA